jgi:hypothetical protein
MYIISLWLICPRICICYIFLACLSETVAPLRLHTEVVMHSTIPLHRPDGKQYYRGIYLMSLLLCCLRTATCLISVVGFAICLGCHLGRLPFETPIETPGYGWWWELMADNLHTDE